MKKLTIALLTLPVLALGTSVIAGMQPEGFSKCDRSAKMHKSDHNERADHMLKKMSKQLELSETQEEEMRNLFSKKQDQRQEMHAQMRNLHETTRNLDPSASDYATRLADTKKAAAELAVSKVDQHVSMQTEMAKILTPDQINKLDKMRDGFGKEHGKHYREGDEKRSQSQE